MARPRRTLILFAALVGVTIPSSWADDNAAPERDVDLVFDRDEVRILIRDPVTSQRFATYVFRDPDIPRPYFCNVRTPSDRLVTRPYPLRDDDLDDHPRMHPGIWLAFGDLSGNDFWRLKAPVEHVEFVKPTSIENGSASFAVRNRYYSSGGRVLCDEICRYTILARYDATILEWDSTFIPADDPLVFGDQEEMGLGVRMASVIAEKVNEGGRLTDSEGRTTASQVWGQAADWCDYSGVVDGAPVGITIAGHPDNFRRPWWHARDYGFMAANLFGRQAMKQGDVSRVEINPGEVLRLRFSIIVHDGRPGDGYDPVQAVSGKRTVP